MTPDYTLSSLTRPGSARRSRTPLIVGLAAVAAAVLSGGGFLAGRATAGRSPSPTADPQAAGLVPATALAQTTAPAAVPGPTTATAHPAGETVAWQNGLKVTAYSFSAPVAKGAPKPDTAGYVWGAIDVQVCVPTDSTVSHQPWYLKYADNTTIEPSGTGYDQFPHPEYPWGERVVKAGACTRGWITYAVPPGTRPVKIVYTTSSDEPAEWVLA